MMYRIGKRLTFCGAHRLIEPYKGKCADIHGHTWKVDVVLRSEVLDHCGMIMDFGVFDELRVLIEQKFDHKLTNDTVPQPTAENIARYIFDWCRARWAVELVRVWESDTAWAEYSR